MDLIVLIAGLSAAILTIISQFKLASVFPASADIGDTNGQKLQSKATINIVNFLVTFIVNDKYLAVKSRSLGTPNFGFILYHEYIRLEKCKSFVGSEILVTSSDEYIEHMFESMRISHRVARKLDRLSGNRFGNRK